MASPLVIILNGYPGVGKLTIAKRLATSLPGALVFDNHLLIDAASALYDRDRDAVAFQSLRRALRQTILQSLCTSLPSSTLIFTECQPDKPFDSSIMDEYHTFARFMSVQATLISIILQCSAEENERRLVCAERKNERVAKLTDIEILRHIRRDWTIHTYGQRADYEWIIDVTCRSAQEVATELKDKIVAVLEGRVAE